MADKDIYKFVDTSNMGVVKKACKSTVKELPQILINTLFSVLGSSKK